MSTDKIITIDEHMSPDKIMTLDIPNEYWKPCGSEDNLGSRLLTCLWINGTPHHVEAFAVVEKEGVQVAEDDLFESNFEGLCQMVEPDGKYEITKINGRDYVITMAPFS